MIAEVVPGPKVWAGNSQTRWTRRGGLRIK